MVARIVVGPSQSAAANASQHKGQRCATNLQPNRAPLPGRLVYQHYPTFACQHYNLLLLAVALVKKGSSPASAHDSIDALPLRCMASHHVSHAAVPLHALDPSCRCCPYVCLVAIPYARPAIPSTSNRLPQLSLPPPPRNIMSSRRDPVVCPLPPPSTLPSSAKLLSRNPPSLPRLLPPPPWPRNQQPPPSHGETTRNRQDLPSCP